MKYAQIWQYVILAGLLHLGLPSSAAACVTEEEVVDIDFGTVASINPCNDLVYAYAQSFNVKLDSLTLTDPENVRKYPFYFPAKKFLYLTNKFSQSDPIKKAGNLSAILAVSQSMSSERAGAYQIFANYGFVHLQAPNIENLDVFFLMGIASAPTTSTLDTLEKNLCFVRADMPSLSVAKIVKSFVYNSCLENTEWTLQ